VFAREHKIKKTHVRHLEHIKLFKQKIENSLLNLMLSDEAVPSDWKMTPVRLKPGPMTSKTHDMQAWAYFPVDALITMGPERSAQPAMALVGQHGCVLWPQTDDQAMRAHVVAPGLAYCVDWRVVRDDPTRYAQCLWHAAAAAHALANQLAQWSFCVQHHTPAQGLASWFLHGMAQSPVASLQLHWPAISPSMRQCVERIQDAGTHAQPWPDFQVRGDFLSVAAPHHLSALACTCHQKLTPVVREFSVGPAPEGVL
jgi:hypothetical protein